MEGNNLSRGELSINSIDSTKNQLDSTLLNKVKNIAQSLEQNLDNELTEEQKKYFEEEITSLEYLLKNESGRIKLRNIQKKALKALIYMMKKGLYEGYIKLPTGGGKTILFALIVSSFQQGTLIMVPTVELIEQTGETFEEEIGYPKEFVKYINAESERVSIITERILEEIGENPFIGVIITTSAALKILYKKSPKLLEQLKDKVGLYVTDEAHTALGKVHLDMQKNGLNQGIIKKAHLLFTATPKLAKKHLNDHYSEIIDIKLEEGVEDGVLVIPSFAGAGKAYLNLKPEEVPEKLTQEFLDKHSLRFVDEYGQYIYKGLTAKYIEVKKQSPYGYAPSIAVCATIEQADFMTHHLLEQGIRAIRVTSANKDYDEGVSSHEAKQRLLRDEVDVVVTVKKVGIGWNVPTLRNIIRYYPTLSEVALIQPFGRVTRVLEEHHILHLIKAIKESGTHSDKDEKTLRQMLTKTRENSHLIEPDTWQIRHQWDDKGGEDSTSGVTKGTPKRIKFKQVMNTIQILYEAGELSWQEANNYYPGVKLTQKLTKELIKEKLDMLGGYDNLIQYNTDQIKDLQIVGKKIVAIMVMYGFQSKYNFNKQAPIYFKEFISSIYGKDFSPDVTQEHIKNYFDSLGGYSVLVKYTQNEIPSIKLLGKKLGGLASSYGFISKYNLKIQTPTGFQEFLAFIYNQDFNYKPLLKHEIKNEFDKLGGYDVLISWKTEDIKRFDLSTHKIKSITIAYGFKSKYSLNISTPIGFQEFISFVYKKPFVLNDIKEVITKDQIKKYFDDQGGYTALISYVQPQIKDISIGGHGIVKIAKVYGFKSKYGLSSTLTRGFQEFISFIYGKEFLATKESIKKELDKLGGYDILVKFDRDQVPLLEVGGNKIVALAGIYGFKSKFNLTLQSIAGFQEFISFIYGKEFLYEEITKENVKKIFDKLGGYEKLMQYGPKGIKNIEINNSKIIAIANSCKFVSKYDFDITNINGFQEFISFIYGKESMYVAATPITIAEYLKDKGDLQYRTAKSGVERKQLMIYGKGTKAIGSIFGLKGNPIEENYWYDLLEIVYSQKIERLTKESILEYFRSRGDFDYWKNTQIDFRRQIRIAGKGIQIISSKLGVQGSPLNPEKWHQFLKKIY